MNLIKKKRMQSVPVPRVIFIIFYHKEDQF